MKSRTARAARAALKMRTGASRPGERRDGRGKALQKTAKKHSGDVWLVTELPATSHSSAARRSRYRIGTTSPSGILTDGCSNRAPAFITFLRAPRALQHDHLPTTPWPPSGQSAGRPCASSAPALRLQLRRTTPDCSRVSGGATLRPPRASTRYAPRRQLIPCAV